MTSSGGVQVQFRFDMPREGIIYLFVNAAQADALLHGVYAVYSELVVGWPAERSADFSAANLRPALRQGAPFFNFFLCSHHSDPGPANGLVYTYRAYCNLENLPPKVPSSLSHISDQLTG